MRCGRTACLPTYLPTYEVVDLRQHEDGREGEGREEDGRGVAARGRVGASVPRAGRGAWVVATPRVCSILRVEVK